MKIKADISVCTWPHRIRRRRFTCEGEMLSGEVMQLTIPHSVEVKKNEAITITIIGKESQ